MTQPRFSLSISKFKGEKKKEMVEDKDWGRLLCKTIFLT